MTVPGSAASLRKDSAKRAAAARRKQRTATTSSGSVVSNASSADRPLTSPKTARLLERSNAVAEEAASVLASVRKRNAATGVGDGEKSSAAASTTSLSVAASQVAAVETPSVRPPALTPKTSEIGTAAAETPPRPPTTAISSAQSDVTALRSSPPTKKKFPLPPASATSQPESWRPTNAVDVHAVPNYPIPTPHHVEEEEEDGPPLPPTVQDLEKIITDPFVDASCLADQSYVMVRSHDGFGTLRHNRTNVLNGRGLGDIREVLRLTIVQSNMMPPSKSPSSGGTQQARVLCYGDRITLSLSLQDDNRNENFALGVRANNVVGWQPAGLGVLDQWIVLRASPTTAVRLGQPRIPARGPAAPVRVGDPIVLQTYAPVGGVLGIVKDSGDNEGPKLGLVTDSHNNVEVRHDESQDSSLLGRLQRHDRLVPSPTETFSFVTVSPAPLWLGRRMYMQGCQYLLKERSDMVETETDGDLSDLAPAMLLSTTSRSMLETCLVDQVTGAFLGLEGEFVKAASPTGQMNDLEFILVDLPVVDSLLRQQVETMLPMASSYCRVRDFVACHLVGYEYGYVMHALCARVDTLLHEYCTYVQELRARTLSALSIDSTLRSMRVLDAVLREIATYKGGALLNQLRKVKQTTYDGDTVASALLSELLDAAAAPYLRILGDWLQRGVLSDTYSEFMVRCREGNLPWESRYELVEDHVLQGFFPTDIVVENVLATGRYWNALLLAGKSRQVDSEFSVRPEDECKQSWRIGMHGATVASLVQSSYRNASSTLVDLLLGTVDLVGSLKLMKRYFLLDQGDFFIHFLDAAETELRKELTSLSAGRVQHWLDASIQQTEQTEDLSAYNHQGKGKRRSRRTLTASNLRCRFAPCSLVEQLDVLHSIRGGLETHEPWTPIRHTYSGSSRGDLTGLEAFMVDFGTIPFPISLILTQTALECYQLLFRHLFFAKHVERRLVGIWKDHQDMKELPSLRSSMGATFLLRQRMLHFIQNMIYYMMLEVIEPLWSQMEQKITIQASGTKQHTIDDMIGAHMEFLRNSVEACLLTNRELLKSLTKLMSTCLLFSDQMKLFMKATKIEDDRANVANEKQKIIQKTLTNRRTSMRSTVDKEVIRKSMHTARHERKGRIQRQAARVERELEGESYPRMIARFDQVFSDNLREFMDQLTHSDDLYHSQKVNLCIRLDYNGYITRAMGLELDGSTQQ